MSSQPAPERLGPPEIHPSEIQRLNEIGRGSFGSVIRGKCRGKDVAIKVLHKPITDEKTLTAFKKEVAIMSTIFHPNICLFMGACTMPGCFFIVSEYLPKGDLSKLLREVDLNLYTKMRMAKDAALGVNWLHCSNPVFIHRDLKCSNLLVDESFRVKVCDFGLSQIKQQGEKLKDIDTAKGTPLWMAPEVMMFKPFTEKCDVYSFGIVLWEILTKQEPFPHHNNFQKFKKAVCYKEERPIIPSSCLPSLKNLIETCWTATPEDRPKFSTIIASLDEIIVDAAISDPDGRAFWKRTFLPHEEVPWLEFARKFCALLAESDLNLSLMDVFSTDLKIQGLKCLKTIVTHNTQQTQEEVVSLEKFGKILTWFGPIFDPRDSTEQTFLDRVRNVMSQPWFHGDVDTSSAQALLAGKPGGTFLVRFSSMDGWFTISQITEDRSIKHQRIRKLEGIGFSVGKQVFETLPDLLVGKGLVLTAACPGSRFSRIFDEHPPDIGGYVTIA
eukprot:TRINITY_DN2538_c0_g1_i1.p1 TRINITY_DN2538_c0_g1~~TRINITY_DN2538_c0_g1_i1.p1  ORF type:complete len:499 (-),score=110.21 TRINITY_DN2538_c0_g1_i1:204-1700(-)